MQNVSTYIILVAYSFFAAFTGVRYFESYPINGLLEKIFQPLIGLLFLLICWLPGKKILNKLGLSFDSKTEGFVFSFVTGASVLVLAMFFLGMAGLYYSAVIWILIFIFLVLSIKDIRELVRVILNRIKLPAELHNSSLHEIFLLLLICSSLVLMFALSFAPPSYYDSLTYHLAIPDIYILRHKITEIPFNIYSNFPQNMEMLYTWGMILGNEVTPNIISFILTVLTLIGIFSLSKRYFGTKTGLFAAALFSTTTTVMLLGSSSYVEAGLAFFSFYAIYSFLLYLGNNDFKYIVLSGFLSGIAVGVKYTGAITPVILSVIGFGYFIYSKKFNQLKYIIIYWLIIVVVFLPWAVKNIILTGNPVFPFFYDIIGYKNIAWTAETARNYFNMLVEYKHTSTIINDLFLFPLNLAGSTLKYGSGIDVLGDFGWILYFLLISAIVLVKGKTAEVKVLLFYIIGHFVIWFSGKPVLRFLYPLLPVFSIVCSYAYIEIQKQKVFILKSVLPVIFYLFVASNFYLFFFVQSIIEPYGAAIGTETKESFLDRKIKYSSYVAFEYINNNLKSSDKVLLLGEERGFYCKKPYIATNVFGKNDFTGYINTSVSAGEVIGKLKKEGITHILYNVKQAEKIKCYGMFDFTDKGCKNWDALLKNMNMRYNHNGVYLYCLYQG